MATLTTTWPPKPVDAVTLFNKFVVAYDFSPLAAAALDYAIELAEGRNSEVVIVHAQNLEDDTAVCERNDDATRIASQNADKSLDEMAASARQLGINTWWLQRTGPAAQVLTQIVEKMQPDLVIVGAYGNHRLDQKVLGSTAELFLRTLPCPVAMIGPKAKRTKWQPRQARKIVCPIDFPTDVDERLGIIARFAKAVAADVELVHAVDVCHEYSRPYAAADTQFQFELLVERLRRHGVAAASALLFGFPELVIPAHAEAIGAHSIMFALHYKRGLSSYFRNSLVAKVIKTAPCPIIAFPQTVRGNHIR
jgi:nucleotide-binding universal stress UspA family protein